jgi:hypothetical protein
MISMYDKCIVLQHPTAFLIVGYDEERGTQCVTGCLMLLQAAVIRVFVQANACSVIWAQRLKWTGFWVNMVKQFKKLHWSSTQDLPDVKKYQEFKNRSVLLEGDRARC